MSNILRVQNLEVCYKGLKVLDDVNMSVNKGEVIALMGPNGAGKSTILKAIYGLVPLTEGEIIYQGQHITPVAHEMVGRGLSFVPQGRKILSHLTIYENLEIAGYSVANKNILKERIEQSLEIFPDLKHKMRSKSKTLSGGQQQMLAIARGLVTNPDLILMDEPSLGLSPKFVKEVFAKIREINQRNKTSIIVVEHNIKSLLDIVHRAYVLDKGRIVMEESGTVLHDNQKLLGVLRGMN